MAAAIEVAALSKRYRLYHHSWARLLGWMARRPLYREVRALEEVAFSVPRGEGMGVIGENGAGKSTLLSILAGITRASVGEVTVRGKVAAILELGSGFHPELTGRQNISLTAALYGLRRREVARRMEEIIAFAELEGVIDQPVKTYSTGMSMRLAFAIATQVDPEVLIVDEALSVGDGYFQKKCMDRLTRFVDGGGTLLFCSHAMYYVSAFCSRALWLRDGRVAALGPAHEVIGEYETYLQEKARQAARRGELGGEGRARGPARLVAVEPGPPRPKGRPLRAGEPFELTIAWESSDPDLDFHVGVGLNRLDEIEVCSFNTREDGLGPLSGQRRYRIRLAIPELPLVKGEFTLYVFLLDGQALHIYDRAILRRALAVESPGYRFGIVQVPHAWELGDTMEIADEVLSRSLSSGEPA